MKSRFLTVLAVVSLLVPIAFVESAHAVLLTCFGEYPTNTGQYYTYTTWVGTPGHDVQYDAAPGHHNHFSGSRGADAAIDQWDSLCTMDGDDQIYGYGGGDKLSGGNGADILQGALGDDWLQGDAGNDNLYGGVGNDRLYGGNNNDELDGQDGNDYIQDYGGTGDTDRVCDGPGLDTLNIKDGDTRDTWYRYGDAYNDSYTLDSGDRIVNVTSCPTFTWP